MLEIENLYADYYQGRKAALTLEQFTLFAEFFPALLVLLSDGVIDEREKSYLSRLSDSLANIFEEDGLSLVHIEQLKKIFAQEFEHLIAQLDQWRERYLEVLQAHLTTYPESKEVILDTLHLFAEVSQDVDDAECRMIAFLTRKLDLIPKPKE
ncbi:MAG: hypothetical protein OHK0053_16230 [Microscillaceae bacterium]